MLEPLGRSELMEEILLQHLADLVLCCVQNVNFLTLLDAGVVDSAVSEQSGHFEETPGLPTYRRSRSPLSHLNESDC